MKDVFKCSIIVRIVTVLLNFVPTILINRSLGVEMKGEYTLIMNSASFLQLLLNCGICYAYVNLRNKYGYDKAKETVISIIWLQTVCMLFIIASIWILGAEFSQIMVLILAMVMICNSQFIFIALIENIKKRNNILLCSTLVYIILNVVAIIVIPGNINVYILLYIIKVVVEIMVCSLEFKYLFFSFKYINLGTLIEVFQLGFPTAILAILISCNYNIDIFMLKWLGSGNVEIGLYGVAYSLSNMLWILPDAFKELIYNRTATEKKYSFVLKYVKMNMLFCIVVCFFFFIFGKYFLEIMYGIEYGQAYLVCATLFIGIIPMVSYKLIHPIYVNNGRSSIVVFILSLAVILNVIVSYIVIPQYGALGAAIASVVSYSVCGGLFLIKFYLDYCKRT